MQILNHANKKNLNPLRITVLKMAPAVGIEPTT